MSNMAHVEASYAPDEMHSVMDNCNVNFLDLHDEMKPWRIGRVPRNVHRFSIPLEILNKNELIAYSRILENVVENLHYNQNHKDTDWQRGHTCNPDKTATDPMISVKNPWLDGICSTNTGFHNKGKVKKKLNCRYFLSGYCTYCRFGDACWYSHEKMKKTLKKTQSSPETISHNYSSGKSKYAEYSREKSHCGSKGTKVPNPRKTTNYENKQAIMENVNTGPQGSSQLQDVLEATSKSSNSSTVETSEGHKNPDCSEISWERVKSKRSRRKRNIKHKKNIIKVERMKINRKCQEKSRCKGKVYTNYSKNQMNELAKANEIPEVTENPK